MMRRELQERTYNVNRRGNVQTWRQPEKEHPERDCLECGELHTKEGAFCSYFCRVSHKRAA